MHQNEASLAALEVNMIREWHQQISALSSAPPPANDRLEETSQ